MTPAEAWALEYGWQWREPPNMVNSDYDYATALRYGIQPQRAEDGYYHWPSKTPDGQWLKQPEHPTRWKEQYQGLLGAPEGTRQEQLFLRALLNMGLLEGFR